MLLVWKKFNLPLKIPSVSCNNSVYNNVMYIHYSLNYQYQNSTYYWCYSYLCHTSYWRSPNYYNYHYNHHSYCFLLSLYYSFNYHRYNHLYYYSNHNYLILRLSDFPSIEALLIVVWLVFGTKSSKLNSVLSSDHIFSIVYVT